MQIQMVGSDWYVTYGVVHRGAARVLAVHVYGIISATIFKCVGRTGFNTIFALILCGT